MKRAIVLTGIALCMLTQSGVAQNTSSYDAAKKAKEAMSKKDFEACQSSWWIGYQEGLNEGYREGLSEAKEIIREMRKDGGEDGEGNEGGA